MKHEAKTIRLNERDVTLFIEDNPECILFQPVDSHDMEEMEKEISYIEQNSGKRFALVAVKINKWNDELTPWAAPPVFGKIPFGTGAKYTLEFIVKTLLPGFRTDEQTGQTLGGGVRTDEQTGHMLGGEVRTDEQTAHTFGGEVRTDEQTGHTLFNGIRTDQLVFLGGYSLAGLFSLWAGYNTDVFDGVVAASPSVWYKNWLDYSRDNKCRTKNVYLSLGDMEWHSKNKLMATVADAIKEQKTILDNQGVSNTLVWNPGNHFTDNGVRTAKGFVWLLNQDS